MWALEPAAGLPAREPGFHAERLPRHLIRRPARAGGVGQLHPRRHVRHRPWSSKRRPRRERRERLRHRLAKHDDRHPDASRIQLTLLRLSLRSGVAPTLYVTTRPGRPTPAAPDVGRVAPPWYVATRPGVLASLRAPGARPTPAAPDVGAPTASDVLRDLPYVVARRPRPPES